MATTHRPKSREHTYIAINRDGTYDAFVEGFGFRANVSLPQATEFVRRETNRTSGCVPCWDHASDEWTSEIDITEE